MQQPNFATRQFTIGIDGDVSIERSADFLVCLAATGAFKISIDENPLSEFEKGLTYRSPAGFKRVRIVNTSGATLTVKMGFGKGGIQDNRLSISGEINTSEAMPDTLTTGNPVTVADASAQLIAASNPLRRELMLVNEGGGTVRIVADGAATAGQGLPLGASQSVTLQTSAAVYIRNDTGAAVNIAYAELESAL